MIRALPVAVLLLSAGCSNLYFTGESWQQLYPQPVETTSSHGVERLEIWAHLKDFRQRQRIGYLEKNEIVVAGSRQTRDFYYLYDRSGLQLLGFATETGEFFRYRSDGTRLKIGDYPVQDLGLKLFYGLTVEHTIRLEPIDPYKG